MATWRTWLQRLFRGAEAPPEHAPVEPPPAEAPPVSLGTPDHDLASTPEAAALQAAIAAAPDDVGPQLVLADLLLVADDPRGELIVLHQRELAEGLREPDALLRYLLLGALYSFPRALPEEPVLPFGQFSSRPLGYHVTHDGHRYVVRYYSRQLLLDRDDTRVLQRRLHLSDGESWTSDEEAVLLRHLSDAIRAGTPLGGVQLPYIKQPLPRYDGGPVRCYRLPEAFTGRFGLGPTELGLAARDYDRWLDAWRRLSAQLE